MVTIELIKDDSVIHIQNDTIKIDSLKLKAGFPFGEFVMPEITFECLKEKIYQNGFQDGCYTTINSDMIASSYFKTTFNVPTKKTPIIEADCKIVGSRESIEHTPSSNATAVSLYTLLNDTFRFNIDNNLTLIDFDGETIFDITGVGDVVLPIPKDYMEFLQSRTLKHIYYQLDNNSRGDVVPVNYEAVKNIIKTLHWAFFDLSPIIAEIVSDKIRIKTDVALINPETYYSDTPIALDSSKIIKWRETTSKIGFEIDEYIEEKKIDKNVTEKRIIDGLTIKAKGDGITHSFSGSNSLILIETIDITGTSGGNIVSKQVDLKPIFLHAGKAMALHYDNLFADKYLEIETIETTPIVPYSKVQIDGKNYYCIEAEIPYKQYELYKYKLQEMKS